LRIDPGTNEVAATPLREELPLLGGTEYPPVLAAGDDAAWVRSDERTYPYRPLAIRIDARTNAIARERLPIDRPFPVAVTGEGVWFIGSRGKHATLSRVNPQTPREDESIELRSYPVRAALDESSDTFWLASLITLRTEHSVVVPVDLRAVETQ
jgi:hypothetical protein